MKTVSTMALGLALALGAVTLAPAIAKDKPATAKGGAPKPSAKVLPGAQAVQTALAKKDYAAALAQNQQLEPLMETNEDKLFVGQFYITIGQSTNDQATLSKGIDLVIASGLAPAENLTQLYPAQGTIAFQAKDYRKAETAMQAAYKMGSTDANVIPVLIESMRRNGESLPAIQTLNEAVGKMVAAGQPVSSDWYGRGFAIAYDAKPNSPDFAAVRQAGNDLDKKWAASEPSGKVWHDVMLLYLESHSGDNEIKADVHRLLLASNGLQGGNDYLEYAESVYQRFPGEAKTVLDTGVKKGVLSLSANRNASEISAIANGKVAADRASLPGSDKSARAAADGRSALNTADAYLGYGDYAKAIDLYKVALTKPSGADANVVNTRMGIALYRSGDTAGAKAAFAKVTGPRKDLADFWTVLIDHPVTSA